MAYGGLAVKSLIYSEGNKCQIKKLFGASGTKKGKPGPNFEPSLIMNKFNLFVHCYFILNKQCYAFIGSRVAGLVIALMSTIEFDVTQHADIFNSIQ